MIYQLVFCPNEALGDDVFYQTNEIVDHIVHLLPKYQLQPFCSPNTSLADGVSPLLITDLEQRTYIVEPKDGGDLYFLLPERLEQIDDLSLSSELLRAFAVMEGMRTNFNSSKLKDELKAIFGVNQISEKVFLEAIPTYTDPLNSSIGINFYSVQFSELKRKLFDALYMLYVLRRKTSVNLEYIIDGLRVLHVLEALAIDDLIQMVKIVPPPADVDKLRGVLNGFFPELKNWDPIKDPLPDSLPLIQSMEDFNACFTATPVIHPIFARLDNYRKPFNDIKPIGIGDLKVVKQWLVEYLPGEISHIQNVLIGEVIDQTHRRLEKSDETFSFSSSTRESSQSDTQSTDRFELKTEAENIIKNELNVGANANVSYNNGMIIANVGANFSYKRDTTNQSKVSNNLARDVISKAAQQVEKNATEARSVTKIFETEETNKHIFDNKGGTKHVTGIYRRIDKKYKAQLFNYGKRLMFEFIVPEPAAFFVESRLINFASTLEVPLRPIKPDREIADFDFTANEIDEEKFKLLRQDYDLSEFNYPESFRSVFLTDASNQASFSQKDLPDRDWTAQAVVSNLGASGYQITLVELGGSLHFHGKNRTPPDEANLLQFYLQGQLIGERNLKAYENWHFDQHWNWERLFDLAASPIQINTNEVSAVAKFQCVKNISNLTIRLEIKPSSNYLDQWKADVYKKIKKFEQDKLDKEYQEAMLQYGSRMSEFNNRLSQMKAQTVSSLIQGQSEAFNRGIISTELKKNCLTMMTKEFDANNIGDLFNVETIEGSDVQLNYHKFKVIEADDSSVTASFIQDNPTVKYPSIKLNEAKSKGLFIQFLEQAFEWQQLAYIFYPYFWANQPKWVEMMNRLDDADSNMSAFLQAGYAKVLIAITPGYEDAVLHFLATREPWQGGPSPVIGDPLFIPLHEELRKKQDDLYNATPEGEPWTFILPTSLVYLDGSDALPKFPDQA